MYRGTVHVGVQRGHTEPAPTSVLCRARPCLANQGGWLQYRGTESIIQGNNTEMGTGIYEIKFREGVDCTILNICNIYRAGQFSLFYMAEKLATVYSSKWVLKINIKKKWCYLNV